MTDRLHDDLLGLLRGMAEERETVAVAAPDLLALLDAAEAYWALPAEWGFRTEGYAHGPVVCADREDAEAWVAKARKVGGISRHLVTRTGPGQWRPA